MPNLPETRGAELSAAEKEAVEALAKKSAEEVAPTRAQVEGVLNVTPEESEKANTFIGASAAAALTAKAEGNTAYGEKALTSDTSGKFNSAYGCNALEANTTGLGNTAAGTAALYKNTEGKENTAVGYAAGNANTTGDYNTYVGQAAGNLGKTSKNNVAIGRLALTAATAAEATVAVGVEAGYENKTGKQNTLVGHAAGKAVTGSANVFIGYAAGFSEGAVSNKLIIANNTETAIITGVMSATAASNELTLAPVGGKVGLYGTTPVVKAAEIKVPGAFKAGTAGFETEAECKAIRDKQAAMIEALKGIGICV